MWLLGVLLPGCLLAPIMWESQELYRCFTKGFTEALKHKRPLHAVSKKSKLATECGHAHAIFTLEIPRISVDSLKGVLYSLPHQETRGRKLPNRPAHRNPSRLEPPVGAFGPTSPAYLTHLITGRGRSERPGTRTAAASASGWTFASPRWIGLGRRTGGERKGVLCMKTCSFKKTRTR